MSISSPPIVAETLAQTCLLNAFNVGWSKTLMNAAQIVTKCSMLTIERVSARKLPSTHPRNASGPTLKHFSSARRAEGATCTASSLWVGSASPLLHHPFQCEGRLQIMPFDEFTMPATNTQDATLFLQKEYNLTHVIRRFSFGKEVGESKEMKKVGGADWKATFAQSLENVTTTQGTSVGSFNYFLKIVPTTLQTTRKKSQFVVQELKQVRQAQMKDATHDAHNTTLEKDGDDPLTTRGTSTEEQAASLSLYQYSTTHYFSPFQFGATTPPGIHMFYDLSPISITISESPPSLSSFFHFITSLCAIIGGVLTVAGIIDGLIWRVDKRYKAKVRIGKAQ
ncbi:putative Endoplasmic reticulum vesicle transporter [Blattamonas nauphoetae]|uniref:Endoplasmic reticulum vesicle transporter n=1 Tax=Blattamonas nauphoetae TaxID=2049346 RepID=A0ABQ9WVA2_9EUKA|nr:putative Endoplasmic reticulum vesicle transporter [Blattamonas nauphoetae]